MTQAPNPLLSVVRIGKVDFPLKPHRPYAVWDGARKVAENLTRHEACAMVAGMKWEAEGGRLGQGYGAYRNTLWNYAP
jgi:hypothetical protein